MDCYRFHDFELDLDALQLRRNGTPVRLERRPMDLLVLLVSNHGRMVSREEIIAALWPQNVIIDFESGLNTLVRKVRNALGDSSEEPRFIETVPGRGYRFIAPVETPPRTHSPTRQEPAGVASKRRPSWISAAVALAILAVAATTLWWRSVNPDDGVTRIAVLPFENLTGSEEYDYLAQGLAEETSTSFGQIDLPGLRVIGGISARALVNSGMSLEDAAGRLGIDYVVESSLRVDQSKLRVTSRLIRVPDGEQIWSAALDRELTSVLGLQRELSVAIAEQVRQQLSPEVAAAIDRRQTLSPTAYELYLKGRYEWGRLTPDAIRRALDYYEQAVAEDPGYALAWAGIAHVLITSPMTADAKPETVLPRARDALDRALAYGADLAEVQFTLASFQFFLEWDWQEAEAAAHKAIALDPNSAVSHMLLGIVLAQQEQYIEAVDMMRRARELDPLFPLIFANSAYVARVAGDPGASVDLARQAAAINPRFWVAYYQLGQTQLALGQLDQAYQSYSQAEALSAGNSKAVATRAYTQARQGRREDAIAALAGLEASATERYVPPYNFAAIYAGLGDADRALQYLDRALAVRDVNLLGLTTEPMFDSLRTDPRFESLVTRSGLAPAPDS